MCGFLSTPAKDVFTVLRLWLKLFGLIALFAGSFLEPGFYVRAVLNFLLQIQSRVASEKQVAIAGEFCDEDCEELLTSTAHLYS